jgi:DNA-binding NarL/FixJ family response regulator
VAKHLSLVLVDDHEIVRIGLKLLLNSWSDIQVVGEGSDGIEAVELVREKNPDVVLMDLGMPKIDGIESARKIREFNKSVRIIMLTSHSDVKDILASLSAGVNGYCLKDVDGERLRRAIWSVVDGDVWLDARATKEVVVMATGENVPISQHKSAGESEPKLAPVGNFERKTPVVPVPVTAISDRGPYESLSAREVEVLALLVEGLTNREIGERLFITRDTVKTHIRHIMEKLAASDRTDAAVKAIRHKIV